MATGAEQRWAAPRTTTMAASSSSQQRTATAECTLCSQAAALTVSTSLVSRPYCLLHYCTTRTVRLGASRPDKITVLEGNAPGRSDVDASEDGSEVREIEKQMPNVQSIFAEAFLELREEIASYSSTSASASVSAANNSRGNKARTGTPSGPKKRPGKHGTSVGNIGGDIGGNSSSRAKRSINHDPLASLLGGPTVPSLTATSGKKKRRKRPLPPPPPPQPKSNSITANDDNEGGFVRSVQLPKRYLDQQAKMAGEEMMERRRMMSASSASSSGQPRKMTPGMVHSQQQGQVNPYKRRKASKRSIWNLALDETAPSQPSDGHNAAAASASASAAMTSDIKCSCGSADVSTDGNITGRNNDMAKGETWGNKDRSDVVVRYRCGRCGKTWHEEE